jgi:hypothetical protein
MFRDQQMAGGRNGKELGDPFDDSEYEDSDPVRHGL